jgi:hypothetical protein
MVTTRAQKVHRTYRWACNRTFWVGIEIFNSIDAGLKLLFCFSNAMEKIGYIGRGLIYL